MIWLIAKVLLLFFGLLAPGAALARALRVPASVATCFAGSAVSIYVTVLALQLTSVRISLASLSAGLLAISLAAVLSARRAKGGITPDVVERRGGSAGADLPSATGDDAARASRPYQTSGCARGMGAWTPFYAIFWAVVLWRVWHQPLSGPDVEFRWSFLAEQMLRLGTLDFYPPRTAGDFYSYFWVESIPPGASALHAWAYACGGEFASGWTIPATLLQLWSLHELLWRLGERTGGVVAARFACLAAAACPLLTWAVLLGQETGLTAVSLIGMAFAIQAWSETRASGWAGLAGTFAVVGASSREYGLVFPALAFLGLLALRADRRTWFTFLPIAALSAVWPLRTMILTGNPFFSLPVGGLPVNERFVTWIRHDAEALGAVLHSAEGWGELARLGLLYAPLALFGWAALVVATFRGARNAALAFVATLVVLALWVASVPYTNGGPFYSLRVTSPALAMGALATGICFARWSSNHRGRRASTGMLALFVVGLLPTTLALPASPWRTPMRDWPAFASPEVIETGSTDESARIVLAAMMASRNSGLVPGDALPVVLADSPGYQRRFLPAGVRVVPLWSPQADWLFNARLSPTEAARAWHDSDIRFIIVTKWQPNLEFFNTHSRWSKPPFRVRMLGETKLTAVFAIDAVDGL